MVIKLKINLFCSKLCNSLSCKMISLIIAVGFTFSFKIWSSGCLLIWRNQIWNRVNLIWTQATPEYLIHIFFSSIFYSMSLLNPVNAFYLTNRFKTFNNFKVKTNRLLSIHELSFFFGFNRKTKNFSSD